MRENNVSSIIRECFCKYSIHRIMNSTSLQNIINHNYTILQDSEIHTLFAPKVYPRFELDQFRKKEELCKREQFQFFIRILERWNGDVGQGRLLNDCDYVKNEFIFSWLKSIAVQNARFVETSLAQLYSWYSSSKQADPVCQLKRENANKSRLEEWEIRNSYKSNLPLEIDNYKRRYIFDQHPDSEVKVDAGKPLLKGSLQSPVFPPSPNDMHRKENNFVRGAREEKETGQFLHNYKKSKIYFYKNMAKNYYKNDFEKDKLVSSTVTRTSDKFYCTDSIKNYRIKTTMGGRPFCSPHLSHNQTAASNFYRPLTTQKEHDFGDQSAETTMQLSNIDGVGLMSNPFDLKLKKKKK